MEERRRAAGPDEALLARIAGGGPGAEAALAALHARYAPAVAALARRRLGRTADAEDLVQETFWRVWRAAPTYEPARGAAATWLLCVATRLTISHWRAARRRPPLWSAPGSGWADLPGTADGGDGGGGRTAGGFPEPADPDPVADVPGAVWRAECRRVLGAGLVTLPAAQRRAVALAYYGGLTQSQIAAAEGAPLSTVKTRLALGLRKLAAHCARHGLTAGAPDV
jgi:RNA polymerase sigma-70 factor (ECF subfamily)